MTTNRLHLAGGFAALTLALGLPYGFTLAQTPPTAAQVVQDQLPPPTASEGGKAERISSRPIAESSDPVVQLVAAETTDGLIVTITIDGATVSLDSAQPARVPRRQARPERTPPGGDTVKATAFAGGQAIATTVVADTVLNASEGGGLVRTDRRQLSIVLATDRAAETVTIEAPATGARATLDVRPAYARICAADPNSKWCPRAGR